MNHIVIIGFMGSGKTRVGKQLAKDLGLPFIDLEKIITKKMNLSAREIFERFGLNSNDAIKNNPYILYYARGDFSLCEKLAADNEFKAYE